MTVTDYVLLEGGPEGIPNTCQPPPTQNEDIKIRHLNRYEHYAFTGAHKLHDGRKVPVYRWTYSTYIAE
ncbi:MULTISPECIES: DUF5988 family protein [Streptomyces]|uniref:DUF5988 family protein n=1 Tax=Streptomyces TaxID=1883 RepID=UPI0004CD2BCD|nr:MULTISPECIES: DUF5988 family protein [Streptomyces]KOT65821.1 hypothetical protein ADK43_02545 [Streptomyces rimosus subsp. rimosus]